jgi:hypothetical protein
LASALLGSVLASNEEDPNFKPIDVIVQQPIKEDLDFDSVTLNSPIYLFFTNYSVNQTMIEDSISLREALTSNPVGNLTFSWSTTGKGVGIEHDEFLQGTDYILELEPGYYGENGAYCRTHLYLEFTTERGCPPRIELFDNSQNWYCNEEIELAIFNPRSHPVRIKAKLSSIDDDLKSYDLLNLVLNDLENRTIMLNLSDVRSGTYDLEIRVYHPSSDELIDMQGRRIVVLDRNKEDEESIDLVLFIILALFLMTILVLVSLKILGKKDDSSRMGFNK